MPDGRPALIELELIEPDLYLGYDPAGGAAYAASVLDAAVAPRGTGPARLAEGHSIR